MTAQRNEITRKARAKINLGLDITGRRADGYHELRMVMQTIGLADDVTVAKDPEPGIRLAVSDGARFLPEEQEQNLAWRAAKVLADEFGDCTEPGRETVGGCGIRITLKKQIPVAAGLAGGSTDAAAVLMAVNELFGLGLPAEDLMARGKKLGADVPYCIMGGTALAEGIGEVLTPLPPAPGGFLLLAKSSFGVSTVWAYGRYDETAEKLEIAHPDIDGIVDAIAAGDRERMCERMGNVLEPVAEEAHPQIGEIRACMKAHGAAGAMMSGSGPSVFGIFADEQAARACMKELRGSCRELYITGFFHGRNA